MPNWAEGVLKIRGTKENIKKFLVEGLKPIPNVSQELAMMFGKEVEVPKLEIEEDEWEFNMKSQNGLHITGTRRAFIEGNIDWYYEEDSLVEVLSIDSFKQAWGVDAQSFAELSKQYDVDFKIYVFERGMQFNQEVEIHKGEIIKSNEIQFDDYKWECLYPNLGG